MKRTVAVFDVWMKNNRTAIQSHIENQDKLTHIYNEYLDWAEKNKCKIISTTSFLNLYKSSLKNVHLIPKPIEHTTHLNYNEQFRMLEKFVGLIHRGIAIKSLIIYGAPGLGKSEMVMRTLKKLNKKNKKDCVLYSGGVKGTYELAKILYENRKGKILVFDDFDSAFRTKTQVNLLKIALQDNLESTVISYVDTSNKSKKDRIPECFEFNSRIIFVVNKLKIDPAIKSRSKVINIELSKEEALERIKSVLPEFIPDVPMKIKMDVYEFLRKHLSKISVMDFRKFRNAVANYLSDKDDHDTSGRWKKWTLAELSL